jgi:diguanylate cyclase
MQKANKGSATTRATTRIVLGVAAVVFVSAALLLGVFSGFGVGLTSAGAVSFAAALLALAIAPSAHWLVYLPARRAEVDAPGPEMSTLAITDPLTQVMNRRGITMGVLEAMAQAERYNTPLSVAMVDIDHFQRINDQFGESAGDKVLADLAGVLADSLRMPDKVGRYEGEEFMVVLPHTPLTQAKKIAERIRANVANAKLSAGGKRTALTVSIGVTQYAKGADLELLWSRANAAVQEAKRDDGNRVVAKKGR